MNIQQMRPKDRAEFLAWLATQPESLREQSPAIQVGAWRGHRHKALMSTVRAIALKGRGVSNETRLRALAATEEL
jgi:hypothetical protein